MSRIIRSTVLLVLVLFAERVQAGTYYADAIHGSDVNGDGSIARPFRTLTRTLQAASLPGDRAVALPGVYDPAIGESFPLLPAPGASLLSIAGAQVTIVDAQQTSSPVIELLDGNTVRGITIRGSLNSWWNGGLTFRDFAGDLLIDSCVFTGNERGIWGFNGFDITITSCVFAQNKNDAVSLFLSYGVIILNNSFHDNLKGVIVDQCNAVIKNNVITKSGLGGIECSGGSVIDLDYNCLFGNQKDYSADCLPGGHDVLADPLYANAAARDLHLSVVSPVLDRGVSGLADLPDNDLDFQDFGNGLGREMGADEIYARYLYIMGLPSPGLDVAVGLLARPADAWVLMMSAHTGQIHTDFGTFLLGFPLFVLASGSAPGTGIVSLAGPFPDDPVFIGLTLYFQALAGDELTNLAVMKVY